MNNDQFIWACMVYLSNHMWNDENSDPKTYYPLDAEYAEPINTEIEAWDKIMPFLAERRFNTVLVDVGDGVKLDSHPEIAASNAWSKEFLMKKLAEMRAMGLEPIPKLNFSAGHDTWMKKYRRMVSTPEYYAFCADIIKEVCEIFGHPRLFHLGFDEESAKAQWNYEMIIVRNRELWWHDFYFFCDQCEKNGTRPWIWSDSAWKHQDLFLQRMPKSVMQSNWFYGEIKEYEDTEISKRIIDCYYVLNKHGYDQIPCCSTYGSKVNPVQTLAFGKENINADLLKGYLIAPWVSTVMDDLYDVYANAHRFYVGRRFAYPETLK